MSDNPNAGQPFDLEKLRELIALMEQHGLSEIDLRRGEERWKLRRGPAEITQLVSPSGFAQPAYPQGGAPAQANPAAAAASAPVAPPEDKNLVPIKSPTVGTYYECPAPGEPPYVSVGSKVAADTVVCIIEAMKVFNQIAAEVNGTVTEVLVKNGDAVDFGQPLFRVKLG
jgi:acetyl-CoA carboxylase biotin carboxyl carrier protein